MNWTVNWDIIDGPRHGRRPQDRNNQIGQYETVLFNLVLQGSSVSLAESLSHERGWVGNPPRFTVIGSQSDGTTIRVPVRSLEGNVLQFQYQFRYIGNKVLLFEGSPGRTSSRGTMRVTETEPEFPELRLSLEVNVLPSREIGRETAATAGPAAPTHQRAEQEERAVAEGHEEQEQSIEVSAQEMQMLAREDAEISRELAIDQLPPERTFSRRGILHFDRVFNEEELGSLTIEEAAEYFLRLNAAISITPPQDFRSDDEWETTRTPGITSQIQWHVERLVDERIRFTKRRIFRARWYMTESEVVHPSPPSSQVLEELSYESDIWLVVRLNNSEHKALIHCNDLATVIEEQVFERMVSGLINLSVQIAFLGADILRRPAALAFEVLLEMVIPPDVGIMIRTASVVRAIVRNLIRVLRSGIRILEASSTTVARAAGDLETRGVPTVARGTYPRSSRPSEGSERMTSGTGHATRAPRSSSGQAYPRTPRGARLAPEGRIPRRGTREFWNLYSIHGARLTRSATGTPLSLTVRLTPSMLFTGTPATGQSIIRRLVTQAGLNIAGKFFDSGHMLANALGGRGGWSFSIIVPMLRSLNRGIFRVFEERIRQLVSSASDSDNIIIHIRNIYSGSGGVPSGFQYSIRVNGQTVAQARFDNIHNIANYVVGETRDGFTLLHYFR